MDVMPTMTEAEQERVRRTFWLNLLDQGEPWFEATGRPHPSLVDISVEEKWGDARAGALVWWDDEGAIRVTSPEVAVSTKWLDLHAEGLSVIDGKFVIRVNAWDDKGRPANVRVAWALPCDERYEDGFVVESIDAAVTWRGKRPRLTPEFHDWDDVPNSLFVADLDNETAPEVPKFWIHDDPLGIPFAKRHPDMGPLTGPSDRIKH